MKAPAWITCACGNGHVHRDDLQGYPEQGGEGGFHLTFRNGRTRVVAQYPMHATVDVPELRK